MGQARFIGLHKLLVKAAEKDKFAFEQLIVLTRMPLLTFIRSQLPGEPEAEVEDVFIEVLLGLWIRKKTFPGLKIAVGEDPDEAAWTWIEGIATSIISDNKRNSFPKQAFKKRDIVSRNKQWANHLSLHHFREPPIPQGFRIDQDTRLDLELLKPLLSGKERKVLNMLLQGLTEKEVADLLGVTRARICQIVREIRFKANREAANDN